MNDPARQKADQDLVAPLDDHSGLCRPHVPRPQRQDFQLRVRDGKHGRSQARRIFADPNLQETRFPHREGDEVAQDCSRLSVKTAASHPNPAMDGAQVPRQLRFGWKWSTTHARGDRR